MSNIPSEYICPITREIMVDPTIITCSGQTYERHAIEEWLEENDSCPLTKSKFDENKDHLISNVAIKKLIHDFSEQHSDIKTKLIELTQEYKEFATQFSWKWLNNFNDGTWSDYDDQTRNRIEKAYKKGEKIVKINSIYAINLETLTQYDVSTYSRFRPVKRVKQKPKLIPTWYFEKKEIKNPEFPLQGYAPFPKDLSSDIEHKFKQSLETFYFSNHESFFNDNHLMKIDIKNMKVHTLTGFKTNTIEQGETDLFKIGIFKIQNIKRII